LCHSASPGHLQQLAPERHCERQCGDGRRDPDAALLTERNNALRNRVTNEHRYLGATGALIVPKLWNPRLRKVLCVLPLPDNRAAHPTLRVEDALQYVGPTLASGDRLDLVFRKRLAQLLLQVELSQ